MSLKAVLPLLIWHRATWFLKRAGKAILYATARRTKARRASKSSRLIRLQDDGDRCLAEEGP